MAGGGPVIVQLPSGQDGSWGLSGEADQGVLWDVSPLSHSGAQEHKRKEAKDRLVLSDFPLLWPCPE